MNLKDYCAMEMGNMSALEKKVDVLMRYCTARSEAERNACFGDLVQINGLRCTSRDYRRAIEEALRELGIPDHLRGFGFLQTAIILVVYSPQMIFNATTVLYPLVAAEHKTDAAAVERSMRNAIEAGWDRCGLQVQRKYFGCQIDPQRGKPANTHFIARLARLVQNELQN